MRFAITTLYCGSSGQKGFYNSQELGLARAMKPLGHEVIIFYPDKDLQERSEELTPDGIRVVRVPAQPGKVLKAAGLGRLFPIEYL